jgi:cellulose synthase/poly-beta-1,6-N-acetylglucosamine synthase-like glycosyltransferase
MINSRGIVLIGLDLLVVGGFLLHALRRRFDDSDHGVANRIILPPPRQATLLRVGAFIVLCIFGSIALIGLRNPDLSATYRAVVAHLTGLVIKEPDVVSGYVKTLRPVIPISIVAFVVAFAACITGTPGRRVNILLHAPFALCAALLADATLTVFAIEAGLPLGSFPLMSIVLHYTVAYLVGMRLALTSYQLPRPTQVPITRTQNFTDNAIVVVVLVTVLAVIASAAQQILSLDNNNVVLYTFILVAMPAYLKFGIYAILSLIRLFGPRPPQPGPNRPPIEVIGPAFNEATNIVAWIEAIDKAAAVYGGPVRLILCDDGSTDGTAALAEEALARSTAITGEVIAGAHAGKATALNLALARCEADYVIRHDTDCVVHPNAFLYTIPWFETDPRIGLVGAFMMPKMPFRTWIDRMRALELAAGFGLPRLAYAVVDSQPCVPGNYTAFRRQAALDIGGWPEGMFGEDIDFTCNVARRGYRAAYDRRVWAYEDVPDTVEQLRVQRRRWNRGSVHNFARFVPLACGSSGPRFWFAEFFRAARRLVMPMQFAAYLFAIQGTIFNPGPRQNLAHLAAFYILAKLPMLAIVTCSMFYRGLWRAFLWWPLFLFFALVKRLANLEALLTLPTRPVNFGWLRRPVRTDAVVWKDWPILRPRYISEVTPVPAGPSEFHDAPSPSRRGRNDATVWRGRNGLKPLSGRDDP